MNENSIAAKHTPGPWQFVQQNGDWFIKSAEGDSFQSDTQYYPWNSRNIADWHLQAAAPELLAALENLTDLSEGFSVSGVYFNESQENRTALNAACAAIEKATGVQP